MIPFFLDTCEHCRRKANSWHPIATLLCPEWHAVPVIERGKYRNRGSPVAHDLP